MSLAPNASKSDTTLANEPNEQFLADKAASHKRIDRMIRSIGDGYQKSHELTQEAAMAVLEHAAPVAFGGKGYGDCLKAATLCRAVPARERNSLVAWFRVYSPIMVMMAPPRSNKSDNARFRNEQSEDIVKRGYVWNLEAAKLDFWQNDRQNKNPIPEPLGAGNFWDSMMGFIGRTEKALEKKAGDKGVVYTDEAKALITAALPAIKSNVTALRKAMLVASGEEIEEEGEENKSDASTDGKEPVAAAA